ncbi:MAG: GspH/FimT family pseudopilin [Gammaproteobacteria bacterium]|jgi:type II secretion system protein H
MREQRSQGITLLELLVVLSILGIVAAVAIPGLRSAERQKLDLAAQAFAEAIRLARSEAIRVGAPRGFHQSTSQKRIQVFRPDTSSTPWTPVYDVYHPVSRKLIDVELDKHPLAAADSLSRNAAFRGNCTTPGDIYFDARGTPWCTSPETVLLEQFDLTLTLGANTRKITLNGVSGRVKVQ